MNSSIKNQTSNSKVFMKNKFIMMVLVMLSIMVPLSIVLDTFIKQQYQLILHFLQYKDQSMISAIENRISKSEKRIQEYEIKLRQSMMGQKNNDNEQQKQNRYIFEFDNNKRALQVYNKFVYNVVFLNMDKKHYQALNKETKQRIQSLMNAYLKQKSFLKNLFEGINIDIKIRFRHIGEIESNYQNKLSRFYQSNRNDRKKQQTKGTGLQLSQVEQILDQLSKMNYGNQCDYMTSKQGYEQCKQHTVYFLYESSGNEIYTNDKMIENTQNPNHSDEEISLEAFIEQYWAEEGYETVLLTNSQYSHKINFHQILSQQLETQPQLIATLNRIIEEIIYQSLDLAQFVLYTQKEINSINKDIKTDFQTRKQQVNQIASQFYFLNKQKQKLKLLHQINTILNTKDVVYESFNEDLLINKINCKQDIHENLDTDLDYQNLRIVFNQITKIGPFSSEYKLGTISPIFIVLIYPLIHFVYFLVTSRK